MEEPKIKEVELLEPGFFLDYPAHKYHKLPYASNSYLGLHDVCPAATRMPSETSKAMTFGRAFHSFLLEGKKALFDEFYLLPESAQGTSTIAKTIKAQCIANNYGKDMISGEDVDKLIGMGLVVSSHPTASQFLADKLTEVTLVWDHVMPDGQTVRMKARVDATPKNFNILLCDLKSTNSAEKRAVYRTIYKFSYHRQGAVYLDGINEVIRLCESQGKPHPFIKPRKKWILIMVEKKAPFRTECYELDDELIEAGRQDYYRLLRAEIQCRKDNRWPAWKNPGCDTIGVKCYTEEIEEEPED